MTCKVCNLSDNTNYKCPRCLIRYCSLDCWKIHKETNCERIDSTQNSLNAEQKPGERSNYNFCTESTIPIETIRLLEGNEKVRETLRNPHVRQMLKAIDSSENPAAAMQNAMLEPIFQEFADACLDVVGNTPSIEDESV